MGERVSGNCFSWLRADALRRPLLPASPLRLKLFAAAAELRIKLHVSLIKSERLPCA